MKSSINLMLFCSGLFFSNAAFSEQSNADNNPWSVSLLAGSSDVQLADSNVDSQTLFTPGFEVGYQFNKNLGFILGSQTGVNFGSIPSAIFGGIFNVEIKDYSFHRYYLAATTQTEGDLHVFGSLGFSRINEEITVTTSSIDFNSNSTEPYWEVGIGWDINDQFGLGLSYSDTNAELADFSTVQFKLTFNF